MNRLRLITDYLIITVPVLIACILACILSFFFVCFNYSRHSVRMS